MILLFYLYICKMILLDSVKELIKNKGITFIELAEKLNITRQALHSTLRNENIQLSTIEKIAEALEVDISDLLPKKETLPLYVKDENGREIIIGGLDKQSGLLKDDDHS